LDRKLLLVSLLARLDSLASTTVAAPAAIKVHRQANRQKIQNHRGPPYLTFA
jgi:hypothetical protein